MSAGPTSTAWGFILLLAAAFAAAGAACAAASTDAALFVTQYWSYWCVAATLTGFFCCLLLLLYHHWHRQHRGYAWGAPAAFILLTTLFLHALFPHHLKILKDEILLLNTSRQLYETRLACVISELTAVEPDATGPQFAGRVFVDKRPLLFPFMVATLHGLTGYSNDNPMRVNALLSLGLMAACFLVCRRLADHEAGGYLGVLLLAGIPLVAHNVTGGGFDTLNLLLIATVLWLALAFVATPEPLGAGALVFGCALLAYTRYESILYLPFGLGLVSWALLRGRMPARPWLLFALPFLLVPAFMLIQIRRDFGAYFEELGSTGATHPFGVSFLVQNLGNACHFFFACNREYLNSVAVTVAAAAAALAAANWTWRRWRRAVRHLNEETLLTREAVLAGVGATAAVSLGIFLAYHYGDLNEYVACRLALPACFLMVCLVVYAGAPLLTTRRRRLLAVAGALALIRLLCLPAALYNYFDDTYLHRQNLAFIEHFVSSRQEPAKTLVFSFNPLAFNTLGIKAFNIRNTEAMRTVLSMGLDRDYDIYVHDGFQRSAPPRPDTPMYAQELLKLAPGQTVREAWISDSTWQRIARLQRFPAAAPARP